MNASDSAKHIPSWVPKVNAIWRQVGNAVGAEFKYHEHTTERNGRTQSETHIGNLVKKTALSTITLEYDAHRTYSWADAGTDPSLSFSLRRPGLWSGLLWSRRSMEIGGTPYAVSGDDREVVRAVFDDKEVGRLLPVVGGGELVLTKTGRLNFVEVSREGIRSLWFGWPHPISDPQRLKALFQLFEAVIERRFHAPSLRLAAAQAKEERRSQAAQRREEARSGLQEITESTYTELLSLGVDARVLDRKPLPGEAPRGWIEIADSPIRWAQVTWDGEEFSDIYFWVLDSRIGTHFPVVFVSISKSLRWKADEFLGDAKFSSPIADRLMETTETVAPGLYVRSNLTHGCWMIGIDETLDRRVWNSCEAIANALLTMPMPSEK